MFALRMATYLLVAPTLAGIFVIALLTANVVSGTYIAIAAAAGAVIGLPVAWVLAGHLNRLIQQR
ncbi:MULTISPECIES: hypothetical protein [unclassified Roseitalea]|uniref:hypothetical protein n=1 Tax=unclassified Roseitalea TaxID=2639107 RepID=UPI00273EE098|nr:MULTISPECIES: hypothetical protein [unclassified Roseitalea]